MPLQSGTPLVSPREQDWNCRPRGSIRISRRPEVPGTQTSLPPEPAPQPMPLPLSVPDFRALEPVLEEQTRWLKEDQGRMPYARLADWVEALGARISAPAVEGPTYSLVMGVIQLAAAITGHVDFRSCNWLSARPECQQLRFALLKLMVHIKDFVELANPVQVQRSSLSEACAEVRL